VVVRDRETTDVWFIYSTVTPCESLMAKQYVSIF